MVKSGVWEELVQAGLLDWLDVGSALCTLLATTIQNHMELRPRCVRSYSTLWDAEGLWKMGFKILIACSDEMLKCMQQVRADARFTFHEQCGGDLKDFIDSDSNHCYERIPHIGRLHGWRPGQPWPLRDSDLSMEDCETSIFQYNLFPRNCDTSVHTLVTLSSRVSHSQGAANESACNFIDAIDTKLLIVSHERDPSTMLRSGSMEIMGCWDPVLVWYFNSYRCYNEFWCALVGYVDVDGAFVMASAAYYGCCELGGWDPDLYMPIWSPCYSWPNLREYACVKFQRWCDVQVVFESCWKQADVLRRFGDGTIPPPDCIGHRNSENASEQFFLTEQFQFTRRFQHAFNRMAKGMFLPPPNPLIQVIPGTWYLEIGEEFELDDWVNDNYFPLHSHLRHAEAGQIVTFRRLVGEESCQQLHLLDRQEHRLDKSFQLIWQAPTMHARR